MNKAGGKRPGAGRKQGSLGKKTMERALYRQSLIKHYLSKWKEITDTMIDLALGKYKMMEINGRKTKVYIRPPNRRMLQVIIETVIGKPKQQIDNGVDLSRLNELTKSIHAIVQGR